MTEYEMVDLIKDTVSLLVTHLEQLLDRFAFFMLFVCLLR